MNRTTVFSMKRMAAVFVAALALSGCQKASDNVGIQTRGDANPRALGQPGGTTPTNGLTYTGKVTADPTYQDLFNTLVRYFMAASLNPDYVGYVSATASNNTGVFVGGRIDLAGGQPLKATNGTIQVASSSELIVGVFDHWDKQTNLAPLPPAYFKGGASGTINGNSADIIFQDAYGTVELKGTFDSTNFTGTFSFDTQQLYDGSGQGHAGDLGTFKIPTCQFFRCN